jgi:putative flippase GtrA
MNGFASGAVEVEAAPRAWDLALALLTGAPARYLGASIVALAADAGSLIGLVRLGANPALAAAAGFILGTVVHWLVSSRVMFADAVAETEIERRRQMIVFVAVGLVGLVLTTAIVGGGAAMHIDVRLAKLAAVGISFVTTSGLRHLLIFGGERIG